MFGHWKIRKPASKDTLHDTANAVREVLTADFIRRVRELGQDQRLPAGWFESPAESLSQRMEAQCEGLEAASDRTTPLPDASVITRAQQLLKMLNRNLESLEKPRLGFEVMGDNGRFSDYRAPDEGA